MAADLCAVLPGSGQARGPIVGAGKLVQVGAAGGWECEQAINSARTHCLIFGWWSIGSLFWNPMSLWDNADARKKLQQQAEQAHAYATWWHAAYGARR